MPGITDQVVTTVTVTRPGSETVILSAYALGIGDDDVGRTEAASRATLTATLDAIVTATAAARPWAPDRLQLTRFDDDAPGPSQPWPLAGSIADVLPERTTVARAGSWTGQMPPRSSPRRAGSPRCPPGTTAGTPNR